MTGLTFVVFVVRKILAAVSLILAAVLGGLSVLAVEYYWSAVLTYLFVLYGSSAIFVAVAGAVVWVFWASRQCVLVLFEGGGGTR